jgi:NADH-quinone oxidoreductase subunit H
MIVGSGVFMLLFGGGWNPLPWVSLATAVDWLGAILPFAQAPLFVGVLSIAIFLGKTLAMIFLFMWVRWTLPRFRYDQVMKIGWQKMLPLSIANLLFYAIAIAVIQK